MDHKSQLPSVEMHEISKTFIDTPALDHINLTLYPGLFYTLVGPNGAGKSTLLRILARRCKSDRGTAYVFGRSVESDLPELNSQQIYLSETSGIAMPTSMDLFYLRYSKLIPQWNAKEFKGWMDLLGISLRLRFDELSRGQQMQVLLASALASHPKLYLLDEVTSVLDSAVRSYLLAELKRRAEKGATVLLATNLAFEVQNLTNHLLILDRGKLRLDMSVAEAKQKFIKIRVQPGFSSPWVSHPECSPVSVSSDQTVSYILPRERALQLDPEITRYEDRRAIVIEELFLYHLRTSAGRPQLMAHSILTEVA